MLFGIDPNELKASVPTETCTDVYRSFIRVANTWKQLRGPSVAGRINKLWYIWTMEDYSVLKRNEVSSHGKTGRKLKCKFLTKSSSLKRSCTLWSQLYGVLEEEKLWKQWDDQGLPGVSGREGWRGSAWRIYGAVEGLHTVPEWWIYVTLHSSEPTELQWVSPSVHCCL